MDNQLHAVAFVRSLGLPGCSWCIVRRYSLETPVEPTRISGNARHVAHVTLGLSMSKFPGEREDLLVNGFWWQPVV